MRAGAPSVAPSLCSTAMDSRGYAGLTFAVLLVVCGAEPSIVIQSQSSRGERAPPRHRSRKASRKEAETSSSATVGSRPSETDKMSCNKYRTYDVQATGRSAQNGAMISKEQHFDALATLGMLEAQGPGAPEAPARPHTKSLCVRWFCVVAQCPVAPAGRDFPRRVLFLHETAANAYRHATASGSWRQAVGADARKAIPAGQRRKARRPK